VHRFTYENGVCPVCPDFGVNVIDASVAGESPLQVPQKQLAFNRTHNETLSIVAMCVCNLDCSPVGRAGR
jgi:hypothetical protein